MVLMPCLTIVYETDCYQECTQSSQEKSLVLADLEAKAAEAERLADENQAKEDEEANKEELQDGNQDGEQELDKSNIQEEATTDSQQVEQCYTTSA